MVDLKFAFKSACTSLRGRARDSICYIVIFAVALYGSVPLFSASSAPPGYDSVMHFSKIRIFSQFFPSIPRWFPWWYCGTPSLRFYPPLSYFFSSSISWLFRISALEAYQFTDFFSFYLAGLFIYHLMKTLTNSRFASVSSAILYMLTPQTLYGRFFIGHFTHNFSMFLIPLTLFCIVKYGDGMKRIALMTAPLFATLFLSHFQTALCFGFMLAILVFFTLISEWWKKEPRRISISGLSLGGVLGICLAGFWLLPSLLEGSGQLGLTSEAALKTMIPIESLFIDADQLWYLSPIQKIWCKQYFLGFPLIVLSFLAIVLIIRRKIAANKRFWGIIFTFWTALFLFAIVSPYIGLVLGWPNRFPYFVSMPMAMLAGLTINWIEDHPSFSSMDSCSPKRLALYSLLTVTALSTLIYTLDVEQFTYYPYSNEIQVSERLKTLNQKPIERVASFGTASYVFNVISDGWQLDGGYVQGQINPDFYYKYLWTLKETDDIDAILETLNATNARYVVVPQGQALSAYQDQRFFERIEMVGFTIFRLKNNYTLNFVEIINGDASINYSYPYPDELHLMIQDCSEDVTLVVKMNYYPGWVAHSSNGEVELTEDSDGLMKIEVNGANSLDITLQYGQTWVDHMTLGVTVAGVAIYLFILRRRFARTQYFRKTK